MIVFCSDPQGRPKNPTSRPLFWSVPQKFRFAVLIVEISSAITILAFSISGKENRNLQSHRYFRKRAMITLIAKILFVLTIVVEPKYSRLLITLSCRASTPISGQKKIDYDLFRHYAVVE